MLETLVTIAVVLVCLRIVCVPIKLHDHRPRECKTCEHKFKKTADKVWTGCFYYACEYCDARRSVKEVEGVDDPGCERLKLWSKP